MMIHRKPISASGFGATTVATSRLAGAIVR
jgi:hypothetical protein